jgi:hypothetical protein
VKIEMFVVTNPGGKTVSTTPGVVSPMGSTQWGSISDGPLTVGQLYTIRAEITTSDNACGNQKTTPSMNTMTGTIQATP